MKKLCSFLLLAGCFSGIFATDSRVITMGRHDAFFMDETSIFRNPANLNYYPNLLYGSAGIFKEDSVLDDLGQLSALKKRNRDPQQPYFGAILSASLNQNANESGNQYPMFSLGVGMNRYDPLLKYITPTKKNKVYEKPVGKIDLMAGYALSNGGMVGIGTYLAFQNITNNVGKVKFASNVYKGTVGLNWPLAKSIDMEISGAVASLTAKGLATIADTLADTGATDIIADNDLAISFDGRIFAALPAINGDVVPHLAISRVTHLENRKAITELDAALGLGINVNIDKGFFWAGLEGLFKDYTVSTDTARSGIGGRVSFGIERNVIWDWFVLRAGGSKSVMFFNRDNKEYSFSENPEADGSDADLIGIGVGINIENRLKIDGVIAEDIFYTFTNLVSGPMHHLQNRICLTYCF